MTLKELRIQKGLSQIEAAKFLSVPLRSYKRYESEKSYEGSIKYNYFVANLKKAPKKAPKQQHIKKLKVVIAGIGYVGLSHGLLLAKKANVTLVDINKEKVDQINNKKSPIKSEGLEEAIKEVKISASDSIYSYRNADVVIVATPTNLDTYTNRLDTFSVESVVRTIREINRKCLIVIKSTLTIGLTNTLSELHSGNIIFSPEFLREKSALKDAFYPSRIIFGISKITKKIEKYQALVESCVKNDAKVIYMKPSEAEAVKLFSNTYLAMRVAFFNEVDSFASLNNLNTKEIIKGMGTDPRIGDIYNNPSIMFEGYCLPKDTTEITTSMENVENNQLITSIIKSNNARLSFITKEVINKAKKLTGKDQKDLVIGIYKLETTKNGKVLRSSSSTRFLSELKKAGIKTKVFDDIYEQGEKVFQHFVETCDIIVSNSQTKIFKKNKEKFYTPSIF